MQEAKDLEIANSYPIPDYDLNEIKQIKGGIIALVAPTNAGKTYLLRDILWHLYKDYNNIYLICPTAHLQKDYDFFPKKNIFKEFKEEDLADIWDRTQKLEPEKRKKQLVIIDDCAGDKAFVNSKTLKMLAISGRHLNLTCIVLTQYLMTLRPIIRENIRLLITFETDSFKERKKVIDEFLALDNPRVGNIIHKRITQVPYQAIVVAVYQKDHKGKIYKYIAQDRPDLKIEEEEKDQYPKKRPVSKDPGIILINKI